MRAMRLVPRILADVASVYLVIVNCTCRLTIIGRQRLREFDNPPGGRQRVIVLWHAVLLMALCTTARRTEKPMGGMCSASKDGDFAARLMTNAGLRAFRGSTGRGGARALVEMIRAARELDEAPLVLTVDGSKGPRGELKPGAIVLASKIGGDVQIYAVTMRRSPEFRSWDRTRLPIPCSRAFLLIGPTLSIPKNLTETGSERYRLIAEQLLIACQRRADRLVGYRGTQF